MKDSHGQTVQPEPTCDACGDVRGVCQHPLNQSEYPHAFDPRKRAVTTPMKDSHGQTAQHEQNGRCPKCDHPWQGHEVFTDGQLECVYKMQDDAGNTICCPCSAATIVQDYREYTADEILYGILESTEQAGWGDPANLGHWLGAAQRWAGRQR